MLALVVLAVLNVADAQSVCCVPKQWEGAEGSVMGLSYASTLTQEIVEQSALVSYDAINQRVASYQTVSGNNFTDAVKMILDFAAGVQYTIHGDECTRTSLGPFREACIPADAENIGDAKFGVSKNLDIHNYRFMYGPYKIYATVSDGCVPVTETISGTSNGVSTMQVIGISNVTPGIRDPSVFNPPASCNGKPLIHSSVMQQRRFLY